jgi:hypothetical protein
MALPTPGVVAPNEICPLVPVTLGVVNAARKLDRTAVTVVLVSVCVESLNASEA